MEQAIKNIQWVKKEHLFLFLIGVCLGIAQFVMIRDFVTILYGEEVIIVLVTAAFFYGLSFDIYYP